jgi:hypothetical protein
MASQILSGVKGISKCLTPNGARASITALRMSENAATRGHTRRLSRCVWPDRRSVGAIANQIQLDV